MPTTRKPLFMMRCSSVTLARLLRCSRSCTCADGTTVRIDDVQHYLSGLVAYHQRFLSGARTPAPSTAPELSASP